MSQNHPVAKIIVYDDDQLLRHPNYKIFNFFKRIQQSFEKNCKHSNVFALVVAELCKETFAFPCFDHAKDVLAYLIQYYLEIRMRQFAKGKIAELKKTNLEQKKRAKLATT